MSPLINNIPAIGKGPRRLSVPAGVVGLLATVVRACPGCGAPAAARQPLPYPGAGDVGYVLIQEPDEGYSAIVNLVRRAGRSVHITMYEFDEPDVTAALIDAHRRRVDTRVLHSRDARPIRRRSTCCPRAASRSRGRRPGSPITSYPVI